MLDEMDFMRLDYEKVREFMIKKKDNQVKYAIIIVSVLSIAFGLILKTDIVARELILILPLLIISFGLRFQYLNEGIEIQSKYLSNLEEDIVEKFKAVENGKHISTKWTGFQHFWDEKHRRWKVLIYDIGSKWLLFVGVPMTIAIIYCFLRIIEILGGGLSSLVSILSLCFYITIVLGCLAVIIITFIFYVVGYYRENQKRIKEEICSSKKPLINIIKRLMDCNNKR